MKGRRILALVAGLAVGAVAALPADAARGQTVRCVGTADFCGATVSIAGRASSREVTVRLTDTDLKLVAVRSIPASSRGTYHISKPSFRQGGSEVQFALKTVRANPRGARIEMLFAAGKAPAVGEVCLSCWFDD